MMFTAVVWDAPYTVVAALHAHTSDRLAAGRASPRMVRSCQTLDGQLPSAAICGL